MADMILVAKRIKKISEQINETQIQLQKAMKGEEVYREMKLPPKNIVVDNEVIPKLDKMIEEEKGKLKEVENTLVEFDKKFNEGKPILNF